MPSPDVCNCGRVIQQPATGRRRMKCAVCSPPDSRDRRRHVTVLPAPQATLDHAYVAAIREKLGDQVDSAEGLGVIMLAEAFAAGGGTAAGLVSLHKRIEEALRSLIGTAEGGGAKVIDDIEWGVG